jgi:hypothetical protein
MENNVYVVYLPLTYLLKQLSSFADHSFDLVATIEKMGSGVIFSWINEFYWKHTGLVFGYILVLYVKI